jgi:hypothetical protein
MVQIGLLERSNTLGETRFTVQQWYVTPPRVKFSPHKPLHQDLRPFALPIYLG